MKKIIIALSVSIILFSCKNNTDNSELGNLDSTSNTSSSSTNLISSNVKMSHATLLSSIKLSKAGKLGDFLYNNNLYFSFPNPPNSPRIISASYDGNSITNLKALSNGTEPILLEKDKKLLFVFSDEMNNYSIKSYYMYYASARL